MPKAPPSHSPSKPKAIRHNPRGTGATERQQRRAMHTGSKAWRQQRLRVLARDRFKCRKCGQFGDQVDHIHNDAHEVVTDDRLQTLCLRCHSAKTMTELNKGMRR